MVDSVENTTSDSGGVDITDEIKVNDEDVKLYSIEELVPSSTPLTIPYLEIFRTNELEFIPYISPYNVGILSTDTTETEDVDDSENTDTESSDDSTENTESES